MRAGYGSPKCAYVCTLRYTSSGPDGGCAVHPFTTPPPPWGTSSGSGESGVCRAVVTPKSRSCGRTHDAEDRVAAELYPGRSALGIGRPHRAIAGRVHASKTMFIMVSMVCTERNARPSVLHVLVRVFPRAHWRVFPQIRPRPVQETTSYLSALPPPSCRAIARTRVQVPPVASVYGWVPQRSRM
ncbi:hypothetical protein PYCCODRAFT_649149 [Trametes coccinea BRFM310]|uniref:Uncharacterized protein n=1 Tax=Trametes coccinea (strain BRFM310) TaxID=1353009 RepID=A0A1Y2IJZ9_TRAC3|nr:hypothetical protein PYCCODRAFT_649149 [Trametes coccinea BRFM310]